MNLRREPATTVIAVAGAKGGTGKTTFATNLARVAADLGHPTTYVDCDVEEPDGSLFLHPELGEPRPVDAYVPVVDRSVCTLCGACTEICRYGAIARLGDQIVTFVNLCHSCGGCQAVCPSGAITEGEKEIGVIETGDAGGLRFVQGVLDIGEASAPPLIRKTKEAAFQGGLVIVDCPPGTACPAVQSVRGSDTVLLVCEPTRFGLHDLTLAVDTLRVLGLPFAVAINRSDIGDDGVTSYCAKEGIDVLYELPDDRRIAEAYARGRLAVEACSDYRSGFAQLLRMLLERAGKEAKR